MILTYILIVVQVTCTLIVMILTRNMRCLVDRMEDIEREYAERRKVEERVAAREDAVGHRRATPPRPAPNTERIN